MCIAVQECIYLTPSHRAQCMQKRAATKGSDISEYNGVFVNKRRELHLDTWNETVEGESPLNISKWCESMWLPEGRISVHHPQPSGWHSPNAHERLSDTLFNHPLTVIQQTIPSNYENTLLTTSTFEMLTCWHI